MKGTTVAATVVACAVAISVGADTGARQAPIEDHAAAHAKANAPGKAHELLRQFEGEWSVEGEIWARGPHFDPVPVRGTAKYTPDMGGRWLVFEFDGTRGGEPARTVGFTGYDNARRQFVTHWADSASTAPFALRGDVDFTGKVFTSFGTIDSVADGRYGQLIKLSTRVIGPDEHTDTMSLIVQGDEVKLMELRYVRR